MWSKNGSYPQLSTDGTPGWIEVPDMPEPVEGKEIVWLNNEWVVRDPKPENRFGYVWKWVHGAYEWREFRLHKPPSLDANLAALASAGLVTLTSEQIQMLNGSFD